MYDPLNDINQYNKTLTIAQLIKFCEKKGLDITRPMVQNYIKIGLLPPPVGKRFYTHGHLAALAVITNLKSVYEIEKIREILTPLMAEDGLPLEIYKKLVEKRTELINEWERVIKPLAEGDYGQILLMSHVADVKNLNGAGDNTHDK